MSFDPYQPPQAELAIHAPEPPVPPEIAKRIKGAWVAGLVSVGLTLVFVLIALAGTPLAGVDAWALIDVALMGLLSYGVYRKSRTCAVLLLLLFAANKWIMWTESGSAAGVLVVAVFLWYFLQGIVGTFQYHRWKRSPPEPAPA